MPRHLPAGLTQYAPHAFATKSPPYHVTTNDVSTPPTLIEVTKISGINVYEAEVVQLQFYRKLTGKASFAPTWERELDLQAFRPEILAYWAFGRTTANPTHGNTNSFALMQPRARFPVPKANDTSREPTAL